MTEMAGAADARQRQIGETRSIALSIVLFFVTLGIYGIYWVYKTQEEIKRYSGNGVGGVLGAVIYVIFAPVTFFLVPAEVHSMVESDGGQSPVSAITGLWILLPIVGHIVWFVKVQGTLNRFWESKGAAPA